MNREEKAEITASIRMMPGGMCRSQIGVSGKMKDLIILSYLLVDGIAGEVDLDVDVLLKLYGDFSAAVKRYNGKIKTTVDVQELLRQLGRTGDE